MPLPGLRSSLVWVLDPHAADEIDALDDAALADEIERRSHSIVGKITLDGRGMFPLSVAAARSFAARRIALIGEAAHVIPPIGAQELNSVCVMQPPLANWRLPRIATTPISAATTY